MNDEVVSKPSGSSGRGCLKAAGIGCLVLLVGLTVAGYLGFRFIRNQVRTVLERFEREGYQVVRGDVLEMEGCVTNPTVFMGQIVRIRNGSTRGLAFICRVAEIEGKVEGNIHFIGQVLTVHPGAVLQKDLDVKGQTINLYGTVRGQLTGVYQTLNRKP